MEDIERAKPVLKVEEATPPKFMEEVVMYPGLTKPMVPVAEMAIAVPAENPMFALAEEVEARSERLFAVWRKNPVFCPAAEPRLREEDDTVIAVVPEPDTAPERVMVWLPVRTGFVPTRIYPEAVMLVEETLAVSSEVAAVMRVEETFGNKPYPVAE